MTSETARLIEAGRTGSSSDELLAQLRSGPAVLDLTPVAELLQMSRSHVYAAARRGDLPVKVIKVGGRYKVVTASLIRLLESD